MAGLFEIKEGLVCCYEHRRFCHLEGRGGHWGVWDFDQGAWRREPNYTRREAASMSLFLNRQKGRI